MTEVSGAYDKKILDGNTILLKKSEENDKHRRVNVGADKVCSFLTDDDVYKYISNMGNKLISYSIAIGDEYNKFLSPLFKCNEKEKINIDEILNTNERSVDLYGLRVPRCGKNSFKKIKICKSYAKYKYSNKYALLSTTPNTINAALLF